MVTCYEEKLHTWYTSYSESRATLDGNTYPGLQAWQLKMLMKWAKDDPVSEKEINRNNAVYAIQNNRNPFIDYPGLEQYIWGSMTETAFSYDNYVQPVYTDDPDDPIVGSGRYALVTDASTLAAGDKILIAGIKDYKYYVLSTTQNNNNRSATDEVLLNTDNTLTPGNSAQIITLEQDGGNFLFNVDGGYLYAASSTSNQLKTNPEVDDDAKASISIISGNGNDNGNATITFQGSNSRNTIRFNPNNGSPIFSCYRSDASSGLAPKIYREVTISSITLTDDGTDNTGIVSTYDSQTVNVTLSGRTLYKDGNWNTICLPFDVVIKESPLDGATAKTLSDATMTGTHVTLTFGAPVSTLIAGVPYVIRWDRADDYVNDADHNIVNPVFTSVVITSTEGQTIEKAGGHVKFVGYYSSFDIDTPANDDIYYMTSDNELKHTGKPRTLKACRAYFQFSEAARQASEFVLNFDGESTGISPTLSLNGGKWYDLQGRRLTGKPTSKGVYINNGRRVVVIE